MVGSLDRNLNVNVTSTSTDFERGMRRSSVEARQFGRELAKQRREAEQFRENVGRALVGVGIGVAAAAGLSVKAAIEWESAWTGVEKTVTGNAQQMAALEGQLRSMARELPATHQEIAAVAEAAGQLGIQRENIASFTRTMIAMGETTNLTADEAATAFAQFANVMGTNQSQFDRMASTVVALGNAGASTERDIVAMAQRLSGAGKLMGATESEILALASSMADLGIEAELGGGAIQRTVIKIESAMAEGGDALEGFADVAGVSAQRFATMYEKRPVEAINQFILGLNRIDESGGNVIGTLADLNIKGTQDLSVLLRLKGAGDLLTQSLNRGNKAWKENAALIREAAKRYATTEAQMQVARNNIQDLGITIGQTLLPVVGAVADKIRGLVLVIQNLPEPVKGALGVFGALVGTLSLVGGGALLLAPKIANLRSTATAMTKSASAMNRTMGATGLFMTGPWGAAIGAATLAIGMFAAAKADAAIEVDRFVSAVEADNGVLGENARLTALKALQDRELTDTLKAAKIPLAEAVDAILGQGKALDGVTQRVRAYDEANASSFEILSDLPSALYGAADALGIHTDGVTKDERALREIAGALTEARKKYAEQRQGMRKNAGASRELTDTQQNLADKYKLTADQSRNATKALSEYIEELRASTDPVFAMFNALEDVRTAQREWNKAVNKFGKDSPQARQAATALAKAVRDAQQAALDGDLSFADFQAQLRSWVKQGVLTAAQAKAVEGRVRDARKEAEKYSGDYRATIYANTDPAARAIDAFVTQQEKREIGIAITSGQLGGGGLLVKGEASGGYISGPGGPRDDKIPRMLSNGEYVVNAAATRRNRGLLEAINSGRGMRDGGPVTLDVKSNLSGLREGLNSAIEDLRSSFTFGGFAGGAPSSVSGNAAIVKSIFANMFGWGAYWPATYQLLMKESGFRNTAQNPTSSAYGMFQFLDSTWGGYGIAKTSDPRLQSIAGGRYIRARYGNPAAALAFHLRNNWYDEGGILKSGQTGGNKSGKPERILSPRQTNAFERLVDNLLGVPGGDTSGKQLARAIERLAEILRQSDRPGMASRLGGPFESRMMRMMDRRDRIDDRLARAVSSRERVAGRRSDLVSGVRGNILGQRDLTSFAAFNPRDVREVLEENLGRVRRFQRRLRRLTRMGFRREIIAQVAQAGPQEGAALAKALSKASDAQVAGINKQFKGIGKAAGRFGREIGNELFGAGVQVSEGLLKGLRKNRRALRREMRRLGRGMVKDLKSELKIASPSREMEWIGEMAGKGLVGGWERQLSGSWFDPKGLALKQTIPQIRPAPMRAAGSGNAAIDYARLGESVASALHRKGVRISGGSLGGKLTVDSRGLTAHVQTIAANEASDEYDFRQGR